MANNNNNNNGNPDMFFSLLTDSLILIIISFLPFQESARTSVLSKRWRNLWRETKNVDLDENLFVKPNEQSSKETIEAQRRIFVDFSTQWIRSYRPSTVDKFRLSFSHPHNHVMVMQQCVQFAIARSVKFLDLDFTDSTWNEERLDHDHDHDDALFELPTCVYEHQELLESLKLFSCKFRVSEFKNLSALKSLSLGWIELSGSSFRALLSNCRLLESLTLKKCRNLGYLDISAPRLRTLVIDKCLDLENGIRIEASKLRFFKYSGPLNHFMIEYLNGMVEADLDFGFEFEFSECGDILYELLRDICCIRVLTVCSYVLQVIPTAEEYPLLKPPLDSVKHLTLKTALHVHEYHGISFFLNSCPHLEFLTIDIGPTKIFSERENSHALEEHEFLSTYKYIMVYGCILRSLRVVEIKGFKGAPNELMVIKYFLNYGLALEALYIGVSEEKGPGGVDMDSSYRQNADKLLQFRRASKSLRIFIS